MKKKVFIVLAVVCLLATPLMAANSYKGSTDKGSFGIGLNLGTNTGVGMRFGMGNFDVLANVGLNNFSTNTLSADAAVSYLVYTIDGGNKYIQFPITVGAGGSCAMTFGDDFSISVAALVPVGIEYTFVDVPITCYLRIAPGVQILSANDLHIGLGFAGYIGALWNF
jgi:hypothetical protein